jgi:hypothetical protein
MASANYHILCKYVVPKPFFKSSSQVFSDLHPKHVLTTRGWGFCYECHLEGKATMQWALVDGFWVLSQLFSWWVLSFEPIV